jgi:hypothetical protein
VLFSGPTIPDISSDLEPIGEDASEGAAELAAAAVSGSTVTTLSSPLGSWSDTRP